MPDPNVPSLQDDVVSSHKYVHQNMFITHTHLNYTPTYPLNYTPPQGSYLVATPRGHNTPYLRGSLVVPDGTNVPELKRSLLSHSIAQHNAYHHTTSPISQSLGPQMQNRFAYELAFHQKSFDFGLNSEFYNVLHDSRVKFESPLVAYLFGPHRTPGVVHNPDPIHEADLKTMNEDFTPNFNRLDQIAATKLCTPHLASFPINQALRYQDEGISPLLTTTQQKQKFDPNDATYISTCQSTLPDSPQAQEIYREAQLVPITRRATTPSRDRVAQDEKVPIFGLNVPTVILSQYNSSPEQQIMKTLPFAAGALLAWVGIARATKFPQHELHAYLSQSSMTPLPIQRAVATCVGYATKLRGAIYTLGMVPLIEFPLAAGYLAPLWGNVSSQLGNTTVPYHGAVSELKIMTESEHKEQFMRQYGAFVRRNNDNGSTTTPETAPMTSRTARQAVTGDNGTDIFTADAEQVQPIGTDATTTTTSSSSSSSSSTPTTHPTPTTPPLQNTIIPPPLVQSTSPTLQSNSTIPTRLSWVEKTFHKLISDAGYGQYSPYPFINERLDDEANTKIDRTLMAALQVPVPSASSVNITPWRQAITIERVIFATLATIIPVAILTKKQLKVSNWNRMGTVGSTMSKWLKRPGRGNNNGVAGSGVENGTTTTANAVNQSQPDVLLNQNGSYIRHIIPQLFPTFRFNRIDLPFDKTGPHDHPSAQKLAQKVRAAMERVNNGTAEGATSINKTPPEIQPPPLVNASVQYSPDYVNRCFAQGEALAQQSIRPSPWMAALRIGLLTVGLTSLFPPGKFTTEEFEYSNRYDPLSGRYLYDIDGNRGWPAKEKEGEGKNNKSTTTTTTTTSTTTTDTQNNDTTTPTTPSNPLPVSPQVPNTTPNTKAVEKAHTIFSSANSFPAIPALIVLFYTQILFSEILTHSHNGLQPLARNRNANIPLQLSELATDPSYRHPPVLTTAPNGYQTVLPTPPKIKSLLAPVMKLQGGEQPDTTGFMGGVFNSSRDVLLSKLRASFLHKTRYLIPLTFIYFGSKYCWLPTFDFIRGNNNGPHPYSEHLFAESVTKKSVEVEVESILQLLRHNGIQSLVNSYPQPSDPITIPDPNSTTTAAATPTPIPVTMIQIGYKRAKSPPLQAIEDLTKWCNASIKSIQAWWGSGKPPSSGGVEGGGDE